MRGGKARASPTVGKRLGGAPAGLVPPFPSSFGWPCHAGGCPQSRGRDLVADAAPAATAFIAEMPTTSPYRFTRGPPELPCRHESGGTVTQRALTVAA
jgi:hypothetical protein